MAINYTTPVFVNGFVCRNCTDVDFAKKHIDPAHPKDGPYGDDVKDGHAVDSQQSSGVIFGGSLARLNSRPTTTATEGTAGTLTRQDAGGDVSAVFGSRVDVSA